MGIVSLFTSMSLLGLLVAFPYAFYVLASVAITRSSVTKLHEMAQTNPSRANLARVVVGQANSYLLACQICMAMVTLVAGFVVVEISRNAGIPELAHGSGHITVGIIHLTSIVIVAMVCLLAGQSAKALAFSAPERTLCQVVVPVVISAKAVAPIAFVVNGIVRTVLGLFGVKVPVERDLVPSAEHISEMVELGTAAGEIHKDERQMIQGVFSISEKIVREVMTPRKDIISIGEHASLAELAELFVSEGLSRILVVGETLDEVRGVIMAKDLMPLVGKSSNSFELKSVMRLPYFVQNASKIDDVLQEFKREAIHFAVVLDDHGGVDGLVTIEDLIEEIVGDIFDEYDVPAEEVGVRRTKSGDLLVDGTVTIDELNDVHNLSVPVGEYDTIAGFVIHTLGRIPAAGETLEFNGHRIRVEEVAQNRITAVRVISPKRLREVKPTVSHSNESKAPLADSKQENVLPAERVGNLDVS